jgi:hypothetical protein
LPDAAARHLSEDLRGEAVLIRHAQVFSQGRPGVFLAVHAALLQEGNDLIDEVGDPVHGNVGNDAEPVSGVRPVPVLQHVRDLLRRADGDGQ